MSLLAVSGLTHEALFQPVTFSIHSGDRIGVVGANGSGKSTLLRLLGADAHACVIRRRGLRLEMLAQDASAQSTKSGGEQIREKLTRILRQDLDVVLLDEPTNHLDRGGRLWLERLLLSRSRNTAYVVASHDRAFLEAFANRIIDIDRGVVTVYDEGFSRYRTSKAVRGEQQWAEYGAYQRRKAAMEEAAAKRDKLAAKVAKAPPGAKMSHDFYRRKAATVARTGRLLRERVLLPEVQVAKPWQEQPLDGLTFENVPRSSDIVLEAKNLCKAFGGKRLFTGVSFHLRRGGRGFIEGANGSGKTTLLRMLMGELPPAEGSLRMGANVTMSSIAQILEQQVDYSQTPLEVCGASFEARTLLACLKLPRECLNRPMRTLSGGECTKVALARMLNSRANLLLLDEPTNHLEIEAREAFEEALRMYPGSVVAVSHDEAFARALAPDWTVSIP